jgi:hypothetical protein
MSTYEDLRRKAAQNPQWKTWDIEPQPSMSQFCVIGAGPDSAQSPIRIRNTHCGEVEDAELHAIPLCPTRARRLVVAFLEAADIYEGLTAETAGWEEKTA